MKMQSSLTLEFMLYEFQLGHNAIEITEKVCCAKSQSAVDYSTVNRGFKKFCSGCKNLDYQARSGRTKSEDSNNILQDIETTLASST